MTIKPSWLKIQRVSSGHYAEVHRLVEQNGLHTICQSGRCPNQCECWGRGTATFMILGDVCTRACRFCATTTGHPLPPDANEPKALAESVAFMQLKHAVITSVTRDDLPDEGAAHWKACIEAIRQRCPKTSIEVLIPDMHARKELIDLVASGQPDVISHNLETVKVRSKATYSMSLNALELMSRNGLTTKTGIMVGLGERPEEVAQLMDDALQAGCSSITIGQYLQPSRRHLPVAEYVRPEQFATYRQWAMEKGFRHCESAPLVRSSYHAELAVQAQSTKQSDRKQGDTN